MEIPVCLLKAFKERTVRICFTKQRNLLLNVLFLWRDYVRGAKVRVRIDDLELSSKFLGANREITLREADGVLLGVNRFSKKSGR